MFLGVSPFSLQRKCRLCVGCKDPSEDVFVSELSLFSSVSHGDRVVCRGS